MELSAEQEQEKDGRQIPVTPEMLFGILDNMGIKYDLYNHDPIFTVEEGAHLKAEIPGVHCRNLFVRDKKENKVLSLDEFIERIKENVERRKLSIEVKK